MSKFPSVETKNQTLDQQNYKRPKTSNEDQTGCAAFDDVSAIENQISLLISSGIPNTSFIGDNESCVAIWDYIKQQYDDSQGFDDLAVDADARLVSVLRAYCEGSTLPLSDLVPLLSETIDRFCEPLHISNDDLLDLVPRVLIRRNLGDPLLKCLDTTHTKSAHDECLWVWESPTQDVFPTHLIEYVRSSREVRNLIFRRYKTLLTLMNAINSGATELIKSAKESLNAIDYKLSLGRGKSEGHSNRRKNVRKDPVKHDVKARSDKTTSNMLLNWLKVPAATKSVSKGNSTKQTVSTSEFNDLQATEEQKLELKLLLEELTNVDVCVGESCDDGENGYEKFISLCEHHRNVWTRIFTYISTQRRFYVQELNELMKHLIVEQVGDNIEIETYGSVTLMDNRHARIFQMSDTKWKRPPMRLAICKSSSCIGPKNQLAIESALDYQCDSDEEWFERYDADDVEMVTDEEEEDDENDSNLDEWIVQDSPNRKEFSTGVFDADGISESVKVYCLYKNWHWIVDGTSLHSEEVCNRQLAQENGITIQPADYGFGFEGYTKNPILGMIHTIQGNKLTLGRDGVEELLKFCHGKHLSRENLIADFKEIKPHASTAEIKSKFKKYLHRVKIDDTPYRWLATPEAIKIFGLRRELDKILTEQINNEIYQ